MSLKPKLNNIQKLELNNKNSLPKISSFFSPRKEKNTNYLNELWIDVQPENLLPMQYFDISNKLNRISSQQTQQIEIETPPSPININFSENFLAGTGSWHYSSGSMEISTLSDGGIDGNSYYLRHTRTGSFDRGVLSISSSLAYGTWEFDWWQSTSPSLSNSLRIYYISGVVNPLGANAASNTHHMFWNLGGSSVVQIKNGGDSIAGTQNVRSSGFTPNGIWYRIKVVRETGGLTSIYAKGGSLGSDYFLLPNTDFVNGAATNPFTDNGVTTSKFFSIVLRGNSAITNIISYS